MQKTSEKETGFYSYGVYFIHFIVLGGMAIILLNTTMPSLWKYVIIIISTYVASNLIVSLYKETMQRIKHSMGFSTVQASSRGE